MSEDKTTLLEDSAYEDEYRGPGRWIAIAAGVAVVLGVGGYFAGHASAGGGPSTLAEAVQQAQDGKLACGDTGSSAAAPAAQGSGDASGAPPAGGGDASGAPPAGGGDASGAPPAGGGDASGAPPAGGAPDGFLIRAICDRGAGGTTGGQGVRRGGFGGQAARSSR
jgi:hypothetical protein